MYKLSLIVGSFMCTLLGYVDSAEAYLDPGTGSMILQGLIASIAAGFVVIGLDWQRFKSFVGRMRKRKQDAVEDEEQ